MLLSFIVMLGIYGIPAVLGAPANITVLTTYIFKLTNWSPPLYNTAAAVAIILMVVTGLLVLLQQKVLSGRSYTTVAGKAFRPRRLDLGPWRWFTLALAHRLPGRRRGAADAGADRRRVPQIHVHPRRRQPVRHAAILADAFRAALRQSADAATRSTTRWRSASSPRWSAARSPLRSATPFIARRCRAGAAST